MTALGIDIGGTSIKAALLDADGRAIWLGQSAAYRRPQPQDIARTLSTLLHAAPRASVPGGLQAVGLCAPGLYDPAAGTITAAVNMPGLVGVPLRNLVAAAAPEHTLAPAFALRVVSDVHAAGTDFAISRNLRGRLMAVSLGTGIGAAVLDDLAPLRVTGLSSGHFGQMDVRVPGIDPAPIGPDGGRGSLEAYLGVPALIARHGDPAAWVATLRGDEPELAALARGLRIAHAIYRPDHLALLGGVGVRLAPVLPALRQQVAADLTRLARPDWQLLTGDDDHHAARGAARLAAHT